MRTDVLNKLSIQNKGFIIVTYPAALIEKVISVENLKINTLELNVGENISIDFIKEFLIEYQFQRVDFVYEPGQYSIRGSIVDIYSFSNDFPYRVDFFGDEVETIRTFDITNQLSKAKFDKISIIPDVQTKYAENRINFFDFIDKKTVIWANDVRYLIERLNLLYEKSNDVEIEENGEQKIFHLIKGDDRIKQQNIF
jgi:transcription-repair coupling factor (superfamily II helicase)